MLSELIKLMPGNLEYFILAFVRMAGVIAPSPVFGRRNIPAMTRIGYAGVLTLVSVAAFPPAGAVSYSGPLEYIVLVISEALFGLVMSYVLNIFFSVTTFVCGSVVDMQLGFSMVNVYDPSANTSVSITGSLLNTLMLVMFFVLGCHNKLAYMIYLTFETVPVGEVALSKELMYTAMQLFVQAFLMAVNMALPFIAAGLLLEAGLGIVIRSVPQMNMFVIGLPLKVGGGLAMLYLSVMVYTNYFSVVFEQMFYGIDKMFAGMM